MEETHALDPHTILHGEHTTRLDHVESILRELQDTTGTLAAQVGTLAERISHLEPPEPPGEPDVVEDVSPDGPMIIPVPPPPPIPEKKRRRRRL